MEFEKLPISPHKPQARDGEVLALSWRETQLLKEFRLACEETFGFPSYEEQRDAEKVDVLPIDAKNRLLKNCLNMLHKFAALATTNALKVSVGTDPIELINSTGGRESNHNYCGVNAVTDSGLPPMAPQPPPGTGPVATTTTTTVLGRRPMDYRLHYIYQQQQKHQRHHRAGTPVELESSGQAQAPAWGKRTPSAAAAVGEWSLQVFSRPTSLRTDDSAALINADNAVVALPNWAAMDVHLPEQSPPNQSIISATEAVAVGGGAGAWSPNLVGIGTEGIGGLHALALSRIGGGGSNPNMFRTHYCRKTSKLEIAELDETEDGALQSINQYTVLDLLGAGAQGKVFFAFDEIEKEFRAIKAIKRPMRGSAAMKQLKLEMNILRKLRHPNIVGLFEIIDSSQSKLIYLVMQYIENGPIVQYTDPNPEWPRCEPLPALSFVYIAKQLVDTVAFLHAKKIFHRDIKPDNILRGANDQIYLADFGTAEVMGQHETEVGSSAGDVISSELDSPRNKAIGGHHHASVFGLKKRPSHGTTATVSSRKVSATGGGAPSDPLLDSGRSAGSDFTKSVLDGASDVGKPLPPRDFSVSVRGTPLFYAPEKLRNLGRKPGPPKSSAPTTARGSMQRLPTAMERAKAISSENNEPEEATQAVRNPAAADIWALGVTFYLLLVGHLPFSDKEPAGSKNGKNQVIGLENQQGGDSPQPEGDSADSNGLGKRSPSSSPKPLQKLADRVCAQDLAFPETLSASWTYVLRRMLDKDPARRATIHEIQELVYRLEDEILAEQSTFDDDAIGSLDEVRGEEVEGEEEGQGDEWDEDDFTNSQLVALNTKRGTSPPRQRQETVIHEE